MATMKTGPESGPRPIRAYRLDPAPAPAGDQSGPAAHLGRAILERLRRAAFGRFGRKPGSEGLGPVEPARPLAPGRLRGGPSRQGLRRILDSWSEFFRPE